MLNLCVSPRFAASFLALTLLFAVGSGASAQDIFVYPNEGQSQDQLSFDRFECQEWAMGETGYNPQNPGASAANVQADPNAGQGSGAKGAAVGAAGGAAIGAIAGDAGKGAAIGATAGAMKGIGSRRQQKAASEQAAAQAQADSVAYAQQSYNRATGACLEARGYSVK
jgi:hypothetical protein